MESGGNLRSSSQEEIQSNPSTIGDIDMEALHIEEDATETINVDESNVGDVNQRLLSLARYWREKYQSCCAIEAKLLLEASIPETVRQALENWPDVNDAPIVPQLSIGRRPEVPQIDIDTAEEIPHVLKIEKVKKELSESKSIEQDLEIEQSQPNTLEEALFNLKKLVKSSQSERLKLRHCHIQGLLLNYIKTNTNRKAYQTALELISTSKSYARSLINFQRLTADYGKLLHCKRPIRYFIKNLKYIREVCQADPEEWRSNN